jgi:aromatic ring-opening dioxygenase catalytic subunit (LigB family)
MPQAQNPKATLVTTKLPTYFISHGGGPWPWIPDMRTMFRNLEASLAAMAGEIGGAPEAVLMISGHWEGPDFAVMASPHPPMVYDYRGFPPETYEIVYPAPGAPDLARRTLALLRGADLPAHLDDQRGFDHGVFAPMAVMFPEADVPTFQVSIKAGYDPAAHWALGRALAPLREEGVLIVGSGLSYHNLRMFGPAARAPSAAFDAWLGAALASDPAPRRQSLMAWEQAPSARICHPQEDHLVPLFAALGAAETEIATRVYHDADILGGVTASSYRIG